MSLVRVYLGNPLSVFGMQALPSIRVGGIVGASNPGMSPSFSRGGTTTQLLSGGSVSLRKPRTKAAYGLQWVLRGAADMDLLMSFFDGGQGGGPYCLVDPSQSNFLPPNVARMGAVTGALSEWGVTGGQTIVPSTAVAPPAGRLTGVGVWTGAGSGSVLYAGLFNVVDGTWLPPIIQGLSTEFTVMARCASSTVSVAARIQHGVAGSAPAGTAATGGSVTLNTTTWQAVTCAVAASFSWPTTSDYIVPELTCATASASNIFLASPEFVYSTGATVAALNPWVSGIGVPRVVIAGDAPAAVDRPSLRDFMMTLAES